MADAALRARTRPCIDIDALPRAFPSFSITIMIIYATAVLVRQAIRSSDVGKNNATAGREIDRRVRKCEVFAKRIRVLSFFFLFSRV